MKLVDDVAEGFRQHPDRSAWGIRILGALAIVGGAAEFALGAQDVAEIIGDAILVGGGAALIGVSNLSTERRLS